MRVSISRSDNKVNLTSPVGDTQINIDKKVNEISTLNDFAAWIYLPVAMSFGQDLHIRGKGTTTSVKKAEELAKIWQTWMPAHYSSVKVNFEEVVDEPRQKTDQSPSKKLLLYSGGLDSTYSAHRNFDANKLDLLTIKRGRDKIIQQKGDEFADFFADQRLIARSNIRELYENNDVTTEWSGLISFAFAGVLFLHQNYRNYFIASDFADFQLPSVYPYVNQEMSNKLFNNGYQKLVTTDTKTTRTEKAKYIAKNDLEEYLNFCDKAKPNNCGECSKCVRTKLAFKASTDEVPNVFINSGLPKNWVEIINTNSRYERAYLNDILITASQNELVDIPHIDQAKSQIKKSWLIQHPSESPSHFLRKIYNHVPYPLNTISKKAYDFYINAMSRIRYADQSR